VTCFSSVAGMLRGEVCCGAAVAGLLEIGRPSTTALLLVASVAACDGAVLQLEMNTGMVTTG